MVLTLQWTYEAGARRAKYLAILAPLIGALVVLTIGTLTMNDPDSVTEWADSLLHPFQYHRQLHHPKFNLHTYFACTHMMSDADKDWDNSLDMNEYREFSNAMGEHMFGQPVGNSLPKDMRAVFSEYAENTGGKSNQIIDILGARNGERDEISAHQEEMLENLCNETATHITEMFKEEYKRTAHPPGTMVVFEEDCKDDDEEGRRFLGIFPRRRRTTSKHCGPNIDEDEEDKGKGKKKNDHGPQPIAVNASFLMTLPLDMTVADLLQSLKDGTDPGHLQHAFAMFVDDVIRRINGDNITMPVIELGEEGGAGNSTDGGNATSDRDLTTSSNEGSRYLRVGDEFELDEETLIGFDGSLEGPDGVRRRRLNIGFANDSAEIYNYVESACPGANESTKSALTEVIEAAGEVVGSLLNGTNSSWYSNEPTCVTAFGKFQIIVDEAEEEKEGGMTNIYERAEEATLELLGNGDLAQRLAREPDGGMFHIEGPGTETDKDFEPFSEIENDEEEDKGLRTVDIILISVGSVLIFCLCCVLCFVELERKTRPRPGGN